MPNELQKKYFDTFWPLELYKFTSFLSSIFLWLSLYYIEDNFFSKAHFSTLLLVGNYFFYTRTESLSEYINETNGYIYFFVFQFMCLIGMSYAHDSNDFFYLSTIPLMMSCYYITFVKKDTNLNRDSSIYLYSFTFCILIIVEGYKKGNIYTAFEAIGLITFILWSFSTIIFAFNIYQNDKKNFIKKLLNKVNTKTVDYNKSDRMFFHDFINHTHSLLLFLRSKSGKAQMSDDDIQSLVNEVKLMQETFHQHYGFSHKNINNSREFVPFHMAMGRVYQLIDSFFINDEKVDISFEGLLENSNLENIRECTVNIIAFHRVVTNLLKNSHEATSDHIALNFDYQEDGLHFTIRNRLNRFNQNKMSLDKDLGIYILNSDQKSSDHLGLESIERVCEEAGGSFKFQVLNGYWCSECFLPKKSLSSFESKIAS